ncbi:MAG TPA: hypothetical protein DCY13_14895 [Verrucomicrobiales bacterium]|nr:hypothetical protein [Verrucomicrobiales bacterium]
MKTLPVATFNETGPAGALRVRLEEAGIKSAIHDESKLERFWFMSEPEAAIHVEVSQPDYLRARQLINEWDRSSGVLREAVRCPECASPRVEFPQITRKFLMPVVEAALMALHIMPREFYCLDCQYSWPKTRPPKREFDILGYPYDSKFWHPERFKKQDRA